MIDFIIDQSEGLIGSNMTIIGLETVSSSQSLNYNWTSHVSSSVLLILSLV